jgi:soluble lytic murein transglycosylase-like protein
MKWMVPLMVVAAFAQPSPRDSLAKAAEQQRASAARQRESVVKQAASLGVRLPRAAAESPPAIEAAAAVTATGPPCDAVSDGVAAPLIENAAKAQELEPRVLRAIIEQESGFRPCAISPKGAKGLMQLMPDTAQDLGVQDPFDPRQNIEAGARYFKQLMTRYNGDLQKALGAYNAGPTTVDQAGGVPDIVETRQYVDAILRKVEAGKPISK